MALDYPQSSKLKYKLDLSWQQGTLRLLCLPSLKNSWVSLVNGWMVCPNVLLDHAANTTSAGTEMLKISSLEPVNLNRSYWTTHVRYNTVGKQTWLVVTIDLRDAYPHLSCCGILEIFTKAEWHSLSFPLGYICTQGVRNVYVTVDTSLHTIGRQSQQQVFSQANDVILHFYIWMCWD